jgi:hypothetical protein
MRVFQHFKGKLLRNVISTYLYHDMMFSTAPLLTNTHCSGSIVPTLIRCGVKGPDQGPPKAFGKWTT